MKSKYKVLFSITTFILFFVIGMSSTFAQLPNDPGINPDANACFAGGSLAGICDRIDVDRDGDIDQDDIDWMFRCGWFLIRVELGYFPASVLDEVCYDLVAVVIIQEEEEEGGDDDDNNDSDDDLDVQ